MPAGNMGFAKMAGHVYLVLFLHLTKFVPGDNEVLSIRHRRKALTVTCKHKTITTPMTSIGVSFYEKYKDWENGSLYKVWPFFVGIILTAISFIQTGPSVLTFISGITTLFIMAVCVWITNWYCNSNIQISQNGLSIVTRGSTKVFSWSQIEGITFERFADRPAFFTLLMAIKTINHTEYILIESLYFESAKSRLKKISQALDKFGYEKSTKEIGDHAKFPEELWAYDSK